MRCCRSAGIRSELTDRLRSVTVVESRRRHGRDADGVLRGSRFPACHHPAAHRGRGPAPERVDLVLTIDAGERVTIGAANRHGTPLEPAPEVLTRLELQPGRPYDRPAIDARIAAYEESLRERGYYEAQVRESSVIADDGRTVSVTANVDARASRQPGVRRRPAARWRPGRSGADPRRTIRRSGSAGGCQPRHRRRAAPGRLPRRPRRPTRVSKRAASWW